MVIKNKKRVIMLNELEKIKLHDAGVKESKINSISARSRGSSCIDYPSLCLDAKQAPGLIGYEVEDKVTFIIDGVITSHSKNDCEGRPSSETFGIKIKRIGCNPIKV